MTGWPILLSGGYLQPQLPDNLRLILSESAMKAIIMMLKNNVITRKIVKKITHNTKIIDWKQSHDYNFLPEYFILIT